MRVVAQHGARSRGDPLHPSRNLGRGREPLGHGLDRDAQAPGARRHAERVRDVEAAEQRQAHRGTAHGRPQLEARALGVERHAARGHLPTTLPERHAAVFAAQPDPRGVVGVHHLEAIGSEILDQLRLGAEVFVQGLVVIEVIARQIREQRGPELEPVHAPLIEAVRRHFHRRAARPALHQGRQRRLQIDRAGRREVPRLAHHGRAVGIERAQRADRSHGLERGEDVAQQRDRRRLAVGPRDADQVEPRRRPPVPCFGREGRGAAPVAHQDLRQVDRLLALHQRCSRAALPRVGDEAVPVLDRARHRTVQHARRHLATIGGEAGDLGPGMQVRSLDQHGPALQRGDDIREPTHRRCWRRARA